MKFYETWENLDEALNFPLDLGELMIWEVEKGYRTIEEVPSEYLHLFGEMDPETEDLIESLEDVIVDEKEIINNLPTVKKNEYFSLIKKKEAFFQKSQKLISIHNMRVDKRKEILKKLNLNGETSLLLSIKSLDNKIQLIEKEITEWIIENSC